MMAVDRLSFHKFRRVAGAVLLAVGLLGSVELVQAQVSSNTDRINEYSAPFSPQNGSRDLRSLSVHPNGKDWLFIECEESEGRCQVLRYSLASKQLVRFALPGNYSYSYAHYSPRGNYILMSRNQIFSPSEKDAQREAQASQILMMRSDGSGLQIVPVSTGPNFSPVMSQDEKRIAFWRADRILPPGQEISVLDLNIWEYDISTKTEKLFTRRKFNFLNGGDLQYVAQDALIVQSYGLALRFGIPGYDTRYAGSRVFRLTRGQMDVPTPVLYPNTLNATHPSVDLAGNIFLWANTEKDPSQGVMRFANDDVLTIWRTRSAFLLRHMVVEPGERYVAAFYGDMLQRRNASTNFAKLDLISNAWVEVTVPTLDEAKLVPISSQ